MNDEEKCVQYSTIYIFKWGGWDYMYLLVYIHIYIYLWELSKALMLELVTPRNFFAPILVPNNLFVFF